MQVKNRSDLATYVAAKKARRALAMIATGALAAPAAFAQTAGGEAIDVGAVVAKINAQLTPVATIGAAILLVVVGIAAFGWVRRAIKG